MASFVNNIKRNVVPNWLDYQNTARLGELQGCSSNHTRRGFPIDDYVKAWNENHSLSFAGDLISAAIMNNKSNNEAVKEAAKYVLDKNDIAPDSLYKSAKALLSTNKNRTEFVKSPLSKRLDKILDQEEINRTKIRIIRSQVHRFPLDPIWYCELALAYVNLGLMEKAGKAMEIAVYLAPESRYITRSAARLFLHKNDADRAHFVLINNPTIKTDPWIIASEIAINACRGRRSRFINTGISMINSENFSPFSITELSSAIGTVELSHSTKKCKFYLDKALVHPNDNSLSQAEWLLSVDNSLNFKFSEKERVENRHEANARKAFIDEDYSRALESSVAWIEDMPFAKTPIYFAAEMAYTYQKDYNNAIKILEIGLRSNPNELSFLNNLAYAYAMNGETDKAESILNNSKLKASTTPLELKICLLATKGLNEYRKGNIDLGRFFYKKAINQTHQNSMQTLLHKAILNYIREEIRATKSYNEETLNIVDRLTTNNLRETNVLRQEIKDLVKTSNKKNEKDIDTIRL